MEVGLGPIRLSAQFPTSSNRCLHGRNAAHLFKADDAGSPPQSLDIAVACYWVPKRSLDDVANPDRGAK